MSIFVINFVEKWAINYKVQFEYGFFFLKDVTKKIIGLIKWETHVSNCQSKKAANLQLSRVFFLISEYPRKHAEIE